jgi:perosamine synthetase
MPKPSIPYGRQWVDEEDIAAVAEALRSDWLTTGPKVDEFEKAFSGLVSAADAVAVSNGTAALHAAMFALEIGPGDEVIVPAMTFAASANCVVFQGGTPIFADVEPDTLLIDPASVEARITPRTKAIVSVDYAGQPCEYDALRGLADRHGLKLVADACHSLGGSYRGRSVGALADLTAFSFHPVKHITTGEGGMVATDDSALARRMRLFRNHGLSTDHRQRESAGSWFYEMVELGYNYRLTDIQCALGLSQLRRLPSWIARRQEIARRYDAAFGDGSGVGPLRTRPEVGHARHLYVVRVDDRGAMFRALRHDGIGVNVHYIPVHLHPFYRSRFGTGPGLCPVAEEAYEAILSLPMFPKLTDEEQDVVIALVRQAVQASPAPATIPR